MHDNKESNSAGLLKYTVVVPFQINKYVAYISLLVSRKDPVRAEQSGF